MRDQKEVRKSQKKSDGFRSVSITGLDYPSIDITLSYGTNERQRELGEQRASYPSNRHFVLCAAVYSIMQFSPLFLF